MAYKFWPTVYWPDIFWPEKYWPVGLPIVILGQILSQAQFVCILSNEVSLHAAVLCAPTIKEESISSAAFASQVISAAVYSGKIDPKEKTGFTSTRVASSSFKAAFSANATFDGEVLSNSAFKEEGIIIEPSFKSTHKAGASFSASIVASSDIRRI